MKRLKVLSGVFHHKLVGKPSSANTSNMTNFPLKLWNATNFKYEESPHPSTSLRIPGLSHESFDRDWNPKMTSIMQTSSVARLYASHTLLPTCGKEGQTAEKKYFLDWPQLTQEFYTFASSSEFVMSRDLYEKNIRKWPLDMKFTLGNIGTCSVASTSQFFACPIEGETSSCSIPLWSNTNQFVTVDKTTRKPARLPDWYLKKYKGKGYMDRGLVLRPFDRPAATYAHPAVVQWTDTDNYKHTNWTSYVRWAIDALQAALLLQNTSNTPSYSPYGSGAMIGDHKTVSERAKSALHGITSDIIARGLHKVHIVYLKECLQGEYIETHVWQDSNGEKELVYFSVVKDGEDVCQIKMWYFDSLHDEEDEEYPV